MCVDLDPSPLCERDIRGAQGAGEILSLLLFNEVWYEQGPPIVPGEDTTNCVEAYRDSTAWMATYMAGGGVEGLVVSSSHGWPWG